MAFHRANSIGLFSQPLALKASGLSFALAMLFFLAVPLHSAKADVIGTENREPMENYARTHKTDIQVLHKRFGATGRIMCPFGEASAFLIHKNNIVATARHNLFPEKEMTGYAGRSEINRCGFELTDGSTSVWYKVDVTSFLYPKEEQRSRTDRFDWVVMRLTSPIDNVTPYKLPDSPARKGDLVTLSTIRQDGFPYDSWNTRLLADCRIRDVVTIDGIVGSGLRTDCAANTGASGGPLLRQTESGQEALGIMSSSTLKRCRKYKAKSCASYAVGISKEMVDAIKSLASR